jgi:hypothetical protein
MIYGRAGTQVVIQRIAVLADVKALDLRKPDKQDRDAIANGSYVVVTDIANDKLRLYHLAFLRADNGSAEITAVLEAMKANGGVAP